MESKRRIPCVNLISQSVLGYDTALFPNEYKNYTIVFQISKQNEQKEREQRRKKMHLEQPA
jgi:hypothetical protein